MFGFLIAVAAGAATPALERPVARPIVEALGENVRVEPGEVRALAYICAMIAAGILCAVFDTGTPLSLAIGGAFGFFAMRLLRWAQRVYEER